MSNERIPIDVIQATAEDLMAKIIQDPNLMKALSAAPKPKDADAGEDE